MNITDFTHWIERDFPAGVSVRDSEFEGRQIRRVYLQACLLGKYELTAEWVPERQARSIIHVRVYHFKALNFWQRLRGIMSAWEYSGTYLIYSGPLDEDSYREAMRAIWKDLLSA